MNQILAASISALCLAVAGVAFANENQTPAADPAAAPTPPAPKSQTAAAAKADPNVVVCKRIESTGTRLGATKVCHTRQEWSDQAAAARTRADQMESSGGLRPQP